MSFTPEPKFSKVNLTEIHKESVKEKIFRIFAIFLIILFPPALLMCFRILTKDSVTVSVDAVVYFHVLNPLSCCLNVQSHRFATEMIAIATMRNILGQHTLTDVLTSRENISHIARREIEKVSSEWGVEMERVEIKDVILPFELQKAMAAEAEGTRLAKAKIIEAEGEIKAAENLKQASRIMMENPQVMLLRYLQTLNFIASQQKTSIFFPFPLDIPEPHGSHASQ